MFESIVDVVKQFKAAPSDDFIRFILSCSPIGGKITKLTQKIVDANRDVVRDAMEAFVAQEALARFGYAPKDVVRAPERQETTVAASTVVSPESEGESATPSENELSVLSYAKNRLFFLVRNDTLFQEVLKIAYRKSKTSFRVYYGRPNNGSLFDYREHKDGKITMQFPALSGMEIPFEPSPMMDDCLLKSFTQRVSDAGISFESAPVLRTITGGQSSGTA